MNKRKIGGIIGLFLIAIIIFSLFKSSRPCFSQKFVENHISKYSKDFTFLKNESYSLGINGF